jgi:hypothetical protein
MKGRRRAGCLSRFEARIRRQYATANPSSVSPTALAIAHRSAAATRLQWPNVSSPLSRLLRGEDNRIGDLGVKGWSHVDLDASPCREEEGFNAIGGQSVSFQLGFAFP